MQIAMYEYIEVNLIGVILLLAIFLFSGKGSGADQADEHRCFVIMLALNALILLADNGIYLLRGSSSAGLTVLDHALCIAYFVMQVFFCYSWVRYVLVRLYPRYRSGTAEKWMLLVPALASVFLTASSPLTGWVYSLSADNVYHRGPYILIPFFVSLIYWLASAFVVLSEKRRPSRSRDRGEYLTLLLFPIPVLVGSALQFKFYGISTTWVCSVISMLVMFIDMQNDRLTRDALTGLYNRRQTDSQLAWEVNHLASLNGLLFVAMLDVDHFKLINDRYGHLSGDQALVFVAGVLKDNCRKSDFAGRFGGDEFLLVGHVKREDDISLIARRLGRAIASESRAAQFPFDISVSIGYSVFRPEDSVTTDLVISAADRKMYDAKRIREASDAGPELR